MPWPWCLSVQHTWRVCLQTVPLASVTRTRRSCQACNCQCLAEVRLQSLHSAEVLQYARGASRLLLPHAVLLVQFMTAHKHMTSLVSPSKSQAFIDILATDHKRQPPHCIALRQCLRCLDFLGGRQSVGACCIPCPPSVNGHNAKAGAALLLSSGTPYSLCRVAS